MNFDKYYFTEVDGKRIVELSAHYHHLKSDLAEKIKRLDRSYGVLDQEDIIELKIEIEEIESAMRTIKRELERFGE